MHKTLIKLIHISRRLHLKRALKRMTHEKAHRVEQPNGITLTTRLEYIIRFATIKMKQFIIYSLVRESTNQATSIKGEFRDD